MRKILRDYRQHATARISIGTVFRPHGNGDLRLNGLFGNVESPAKNGRACAVRAARRTCEEMRDCAPVHPAHAARHCMLTREKTTNAA
jgi:hypothetical protein